MVVVNWDVSVKLMYTLSTLVGSDSVTDTVIQDGSLRRCNNSMAQFSFYCEFETLFRQDIARALDVLADELDVTLVSASGLDSVIVSFRFVPVHEKFFVAHWVDIKIHELVTQVRLGCGEDTEIPFLRSLMV